MHHCTPAPPNMGHATTADHAQHLPWVHRPARGEKSLIKWYYGELKEGFASSTSTKPGGPGPCAGSGTQQHQGMELLPKVGCKATPNQVGSPSKTSWDGFKSPWGLTNPSEPKIKVGKGDTCYITALQSDFWGCGGRQHVLEVDVGADQHVVEEENLPLLGLDELPPVSVHRLRQRLAEQELPLPRAQQLRRGWKRAGTQPGGFSEPPAPEFGLLSPYYYALIVRIFLQPGAHTALSSAETDVRHALMQKPFAPCMSNHGDSRALEDQHDPFSALSWVSFHPLTLNPNRRTELAGVPLRFLSPAQDVSQELHLRFAFVLLFTNNCKIRRVRQHLILSFPWRGISPCQPPDLLLLNILSAKMGILKQRGSSRLQSSTPHSEDEGVRPKDPPC